MVNQQHLDILKQGVKVWNKWREEHPDILPDLSGANLESMNLSEVNFSRAILGRIGRLTERRYICSSQDKAKGANLSHAILAYADLSYTILCGANFTQANLHGAVLAGATVFETYRVIGAYFSETQGRVGGVNFSYADLSDADLSDIILFRANLKDTNLKSSRMSRVKLYHANSSYANFSGADLSFATLNDVDLNGAYFDYVRMFETTFADVDLSTVKGLDTVEHRGPSTIGIDTIIRSQGKILEIFLRNAGVTDSLIEAIPYFISSLKPIDFYSCFISYSSKDQDFAEHLYADLQSKGVRCWFAPKDMDIGDKIRPRIEESIRLYDKLLLVLSEHSIASNWVAYEVERALNKEPEGVPNVLYPIRLDDAVMKSKAGWADDIRQTRHIGDFTHWTNHDDYQKAFNRLLRALKAEAQKMGSQ